MKSSKLSEIIIAGDPAPFDFSAEWGKFVNRWFLIYFFGGLSLIYLIHAGTFFLRIDLECTSICELMFDKRFSQLDGKKVFSAQSFVITVWVSFIFLAGFTACFFFQYFRLVFGQRKKSKELAYSLFNAVSFSFWALFITYISFFMELSDEKGANISMERFLFFPFHPLLGIVSSICLSAAIFRLCLLPLALIDVLRGRYGK